MKIKNIIPLCLPLLLLLNKGIAQEIKGDTIFVTTEFPVQIKFPTDNIIASFSNPNAPYSWTSVGQNLQIRAKAANDKCSNLIVNEGKRNHVLIICYKKNLDPENLAEVLHDWGSVKKLELHKKEVDSRPQAKSVAVAVQPKVSKDPPPQKQTTRSEPVASASNSSSSYYKLLEDGDQYLKNGRFDDAEAKYQEVLKIQPDNNFAKKGIADVKEKRVEKENQAKKELNDKITKLRTSATVAFSAKQYDEAIKGYNDVLELNPNDLFSKNQIAVIEKLKADKELKDKQEKDNLAKKQVNDKINNVKLKATKAFDEKRYDDAIIAYNEVLELSPDDVIAKSRIETIQKIQTQNVLKEKQERDNKDRDESFRTIVANADKAFNSKDFEVAKAGYLAAKDLKPGDALLDKKIRDTNDKILLKEKEDEYTAAVKSGDDAKNSGDYEKAKTEYTKASAIFKDRPYPINQLKEINKAASSVLAAETAQKEKQAKEIQKNSNYQSAIEKADKSLEKKDYVSAKSMYSQASALKPEEVYPKDRLAEIALIFENREKEKKAKADSLAFVNDVGKRYTAAILKGKTAFDRREYEVAKIAYMDAAQMRPTAAEPKDMLDLIDRRLSGSNLDRRYDSAMMKGNLALADNNNQMALEYYKEAQKLKPLSTFVLTQIKMVQGMMGADSTNRAIDQQQAELAVLQDVNKKRFDEGMKAYSKYEAAAQFANFEDQLYYLKQFLNIIPDNSLFNQRQYNDDPIEFAKKKIQTIRDYLVRTKGSKYQIEAIPYLNQELEKKYETINFSTPPEEQVFETPAAANNADNIKLGKEVLNEKPRLDLSDSAKNIKLVCQGISFKNGYAFFKLQIQNYTSNEFLTGAMELKAAKSGKNAVVYKPVYISAFPIVLPGKEFFIVYQTKDFDAKDALKFELNDRLKKNKLTVTIPASVYQDEKKQNL